MRQRRLVTVGDLIVYELRSIDGLATVADVMELMRQYGVSPLAVNRRDNTDEVGLISVSDIVRDVIGPNRLPERMNVYEIMSKSVVIPPRTCSLRRAPVGAV